MFTRIASGNWRAGAKSRWFWGRVIAHELGHLLLGKNTHSAAGIMHATWRARDLEPTREAARSFLPGEAKKIRAQALARLNNCDQPTEAIPSQSPAVHSSILTIREQDHRRMKQRIRPMLGFKRFENAVVTISGIELAEKIKKGQFKTGKLGGWHATMTELWNAALAA